MRKISIVLVVLLAVGVLTVLVGSAVSASDEVSISFDDLAKPGPAIAQHVRDQFELMIKEAVNTSGGPPGFKGHIVAKGSVDFLGAGPWTMSVDGKNVGAVAFYFRISARVKLDVDVLSNPVKFGAVDTTQIHAVLCVPRIKDGKVTVGFDAETVSNFTQQERQFTRGMATDFGTELAKSVRTKVRELSEKKFQLPAVLKPISRFVSLAITDSALTATIGPSADGYAAIRFEPEKQGPPKMTVGAVYVGDPLLDLGEGSQGVLQFFKHKNCEELVAQINVAPIPEGGCWDPPKAIKDKASSVRFRLPEGTIIRLTKNKDCEGDQVGLIGEGEIRQLNMYGMNDAVSRLKRETAAPGRQEATNTITFYKDSKFDGKAPLVVRIGGAHPFKSLRIEDQPGGDGWGNEASSIRWDLAPGTVVFLTQDADGTGNNFVITGSGELPHLDDVGLNDQLSAFTVLP